MDVSKNRGFYPPNHPFVHRVFHYIHHPFWGTPIFGNTHIKPYQDFIILGDLYKYTPVFTNIAGWKMDPD